MTASERRDLLDLASIQAATIRDLRARVSKARELIDDLYDPEIGEGTRGEVHDPLLDVLRVLNLSNKKWRAVDAAPAVPKSSFRLTKAEALCLFDALNLHLHEYGRHMNRKRRKMLKSLKARVLGRST